MRVTLLFVLIALLWGAIYLGMMLSATGGHFSMPLDDSYIFFQYARRAVEGHFLSYQAGDPISSGATSWLTVLVHALGYLIGFRGSAMSLWAILVGVAGLGWSAHSARELGRRLCPEVAWLPPALVLVSGPLIWGFLSGMDIPIFGALTLAFAAAWPREGDPPPRRLFVYGALLGLTRPESVFLVGPAFLLGLGFRARRRLWILALAGVLLPFVGQALTAGSWRSASMDVKSIFATPGFTADAWLAGGLSFWQQIVKGVLGGGLVSTDAARVAANDGSAIGFYLPPLTLGLLLVGLLPGAWLEGRRRRPGPHLLLFLWTALLLLAVSFMVPRTWHWHRYLMPAYLCILPGLAAGAARMGRLLETMWKELPAGEGARIAAVAMVLLSLPGAGFFAIAYARNCADIYFQQIELAGRLDRSEPVHPTRLGLHDAGALTYFGTYRVLDLEGLVSPEFRGPGRLGAAGVWETLEQLPPRERPDVLAMHPNWFDPVFLTPHRLVHSQRLFRTSITAGNPMNVYLADWRLAGAGDEPRDPQVQSALAGMILMAEVDIADLESEAAAGYRFGVLDGATGTPLRRLRTADGSPLLDGGRLISGWEAFDLPPAGPEDSVVLVTRTEGPFRIRVETNGVLAGIWVQGEGRSETWQESFFVIPEGSLETGRNRIRLSSDDPHHSAYGSFHYWIYRP